VASLSQGRTAAAQCGLFTHKSVPVIFEPPCISDPRFLSKPMASGFSIYYKVAVYNCYGQLAYFLVTMHSTGLRRLGTQNTG